MATAQGTVRVHQHEHTVTFRVEGRVTIPHSVPLRAFAERSLAEGARRVLIDLRDCVYMDSTFLGTLLTLKKVTARQHQVEFFLVAPSEGCEKLFEQMGLGGLFAVSGEEIDLNADWQELPVDQQPDLRSIKRNVVQAHEELASLPGTAGEQFRTVARCLAQAAENEKKNAPANSTSRPE